MITQQFETKTFALVGSPISHSKSPLIFGAAYAADCGFKYVLHETTNMREVEELLKNGTLQGVNVTAPVKAEAIKIADELSQATAAICATNTIERRVDGSLKAYNTDQEGITQTIKEFNINLKNKNCLVLGAGGGGLAAAYALSNLDAKVIIANRTKAKAAQLAKNINCGIVGLNDDDFEDAFKCSTFIINTLPPKIDAINGEWFCSAQTFFDASYIGSATGVKAQAAGCKYIDGRYWLLYQGAASYRIFTGLEPNVQAMRKALFKL